MAYTKLELVEPIYELQEKETERQYYFFHIYCHEDSDISSFARSLDGLKKGDIWRNMGREIQLEFNPPKDKTFQQWNAYNQWKTRKREYWKCRLKNIRDELQKDLIEFFKADSVELRKSAQKDWLLDKQIDMDDKTPAHLKSKGKNELATAHQKKIDTLLIESGMPSDITQSEVNMNVEADVKQEVSADVKLKKMQELADRMEGMTYD